MLLRSSNIIRCLQLMFIISAQFFCQVGQSSAVSQDDQSSELALKLYEGEYAYREATTLYIVVHAKQLIAVVGEGKYPLRQTGVDQFANAVGDVLPFERNWQGEVIAFREKGNVLSAATI